jgi:CDP-diacylglycerol--glycerol-3-phosphate 3-phosphatidyltransferase
MSFPTQLTVLRIILVPVFYLLFAVIDPPLVLWAGIVFLVAAVSDWYDGYYARQLNLVTPLGAFLDPLADKLLTSAAFIGFASRGLIPVWMVLIVIFRDIYLTLFRMSADSVGAKVKTSFFAKMKTFTQMVFIGLVLFALTASSWSVGIASLTQRLIEPQTLFWVMLGVTLMTALSAGEYTYDNWHVLVNIGRRYFGRRSAQEL